MNLYLELDNRSINVIKGVSICMIVFFHIHCLTGTLNFYIHNFILPAFMFASGILYFRFTRRHKASGINNRGGYKSFVISKLKRLIVPYMSLGVTYSIMKIAFYAISGSDVDIVINFICLIINPRSSLAPFIWFLMTLFFIFLIVHAVPSKYMNILFITSFVLYLLAPYLPAWFCLCDVCNYLVFFMFGYMVDKFSKHDNSKTLCYTLVIRLVLSAIYILILNIFSKTRISQPFEFIGEFSGSIYFLSSFVISLFVGFLGDNLWPLIGILSIFIPIFVDILSKKYKMNWFRFLFLGDTH